MKYSEIYDIVKSIPKGMVSTYGLIAMATGNIRRSRVVGTAMSRCSDKSVPCHRVIRQDGSMSRVFGVGGSDYQRFLLEHEGVGFLEDGRVDMENYLYIPSGKA